MAYIVKITEANKFAVLAIIVLLFIIVSNPRTYSAVSRAVTYLGSFLKQNWKTADGGCGNQAGIALHALVFAILLYLVLTVYYGATKKKDEDEDEE